MTTTSVWTCGMLYDVSDGAFGRKDMAGLEKPIIEEIFHIVSFNSRAKFDRTDVPIMALNLPGGATDSGLIRWAAECFENYDHLGAQLPTVFELPFNSITKWHLKIHKKPQADGPLTFYIMGAPEMVRRLRSRVLTGRYGQSI